MKHARMNKAIPARDVADLLAAFAPEVRNLALAARQASKKWTMPIFHWREALNHFTILWPERMPTLERAAQ